MGQSGIIAPPTSFICRLRFLSMGRLLMSTPTCGFGIAGGSSKSIRKGEGRRRRPTRRWSGAGRDYDMSLEVASR